MLHSAHAHGHRAVVNLRKRSDRRGRSRCEIGPFSFATLRTAAALRVTVTLRVTAYFQTTVIPPGGFHLKHIYEKLQVHSKTEAVAKALRERLI